MTENAMLDAKNMEKWAKNASQNVFIVDWCYKPSMSVNMLS